MRITPTKEQLAYLSSIGAAEDSPFPEVHRPAKAEADDCVMIDRYSTSSLGLVWWFIIFIAVILALLSCSDGAAQEKDNPQSSPVPEIMNGNDSAMTQSRLAALELRVDMIANLVERMRKDTASRLELVDLQRRLLLFRKDTDKIIGDAMQSNQSTAASLRTQFGAEKTRMLTFIRKEIESQSDYTFQVLILLIIAGYLLTVLVAAGVILMKKRLNHLETLTITHAIGIPENETRANSEDKGKNLMAKQVISYGLGVKPKRFVIRSPLNSPGQTMELIIQYTARIKQFRVKPYHPKGHWTMGLSTAKGNVRSENQDYGLAFQMDNGYSVAIVADGLGGVPLGRYAAYLATVTAAVSVLQTYSKSSLLYTSCARDAAGKAIKDAAYRLAIEGDKRNIFDSRGGLRTTLIVLVANKREVGYAYIGDGGGCIVRANGGIEHFLAPQKADGFAMNVLAASLGPTTEGDFVAGAIKREAGDLILIGSDGVFDRVGPEFPKDALRGCIQFNGDLQATADRIISELAEFKDSAGFVCEDNLTLALMGDGTPPHLAQGSWNTNSTRNAPAGTPAQVAETVKEAVK